MATATKEPKAAKTAALKRDSGAASTAVAVRKTNSNIVSIQEQLKKQAEGMAGRVLPASGSKIRTSNEKIFTLPDGSTSEELEVVIVDFRTVHNFYEDGYKEGETTPPACYASGLDPKNMVPAANSPNPQAKTCEECPMHEWGSDGKGKACKEGRLMAVLPPDADENTPIWLLQASPTAVKGFDGYASGVVRVFGVPPVGVVTKVTFDANQKYGTLVFGDPQPNKNLEVSVSRQGEAAAMLDAERDVSGYAAATAKKSPKAAAKSIRR